MRLFTWPNHTITPEEGMNILNPPFDLALRITGPGNALNEIIHRNAPTLEAFVRRAMVNYDTLLRRCPLD